MEFVVVDLVVSEPVRVQDVSRARVQGRLARHRPHVVDCRGLAAHVERETGGGEEDVGERFVKGGGRVGRLLEGGDEGCDARLELGESGPEVGREGLVVG